LIDCDLFMLFFDLVKLPSNGIRQQNTRRQMAIHGGFRGLQERLRPKDADMIVLDQRARSQSAIRLTAAAAAPIIERRQAGLGAADERDRHRQGGMIAAVLTRRKTPPTLHMYTGIAVYI
jgi:hypothetical protein